MFSRARTARLILLAATVLVAADGAANAQSPATASFAVQTNVLKRCTVSANPLTFPDYNPVTGAAVNGQTTLSIACTKNVAASIELGNGTHGVRNLSDGTESLAYDLFSDAARTTRWSTGTAALPYTATNRDAVTQYIHGTISANQDVADRGTAYTDTVTITVNY